jgi:hypothetical protein
MADNAYDNASRDVRPVETVEDFKLRIAAIIRAKPDEVPAPPPPHALWVRHKKRASNRKANVERFANCTFMKPARAKIMFA